LLFKEFLEESLVWICFTIGQQGIQLFLLDEFPKLFIVFYRFMERFFNPEKFNPSNPFQILDKLITCKAIVPIDQDLTIWKSCSNGFSDLDIPLHTFGFGHPFISSSYF